MGSKSSTVIQTTTATDNSTLQALAGVRGDGNVTQILDGDAIKASYAYAAKVGDNTSNNINSLLNTVDSVAGKAINANSEANGKTIKALQDGMNSSIGTVKEAYAKATNSGIDPQAIMLGLAALAALAFVFRG